MSGKEETAIPTEFMEAKNLEADKIEALRNSERYFLKNKSRIDKNLKDHHLKEGDLIYMHNGSR